MVRMTILFCVPIMLASRCSVDNAVPDSKRGRFVRDRAGYRDDELPRPKRRLGTTLETARHATPSFFLMTAAHSFAPFSR